jgi:hypothetical protein
LHMADSSEQRRRSQQAVAAARQARTEAKYNHVSLFRVWRHDRRVSEIERRIDGLGDARRHARLDSWPDRQAEGFRARLLRKLRDRELDRKEVSRPRRKTRKLDRSTRNLRAAATPGSRRRKARH